MSLSDKTDDWLAERRAKLRDRTIPRINKLLVAAQAEKADIEQEFFDRFTARNADGTRAAGYSITRLKDDHYPEQEDREAFEEYMNRSKKFYLRQNRLATRAIREEQDILNAEKKDWLDRLEEDGWSKELCTKCLEHIAWKTIADLNYTEEEGTELLQKLQQKLTVLEVVGAWKDSTTMALEEAYRIPGVVMREKFTLSQKKVS